MGRCDNAAFSSTATTLQPQQNSNPTQLHRRRLTLSTRGHSVSKRLTYPPSPLLPSLRPPHETKKHPTAVSSHQHPTVSPAAIAFDGNRNKTTPPRPIFPWRGVVHVPGSLIDRDEIKPPPPSPAISVSGPDIWASIESKMIFMSKPAGRERNPPPLQTRDFHGTQNEALKEEASLVRIHRPILWDIWP